MARGRTRTVFARRWSGDLSSRGPAELIIEEPLTIHRDGDLVATTMRTPGNDFELAVGFLHAEGALDGASIATVRYCGTGPALETEFNVVTVDTDGAGPDLVPRLQTVTSACGLCGADDIADLRARLGRLPHSRPWALDVVAAVGDLARADQGLFDATGAVHAAAAFDRAGRLLTVREDIGRHNAVDKVVGRLRLDARLPARDLGLFVSGRASFEMVQKAWAAGFETLVAVSGPSALAVEAARAAGLELVGFARGDSLTVYNPDD
jgi:FdhD protein